MRRFAQVLCKAGAAAVARATPSPLPVVRATLDAVGRQVSLGFTHDTWSWRAGTRVKGLW